MRTPTVQATTPQTLPPCCCRRLVGQVVREVLCERQLHYLYRNCARGSPKREELLQKYGHFQVGLWCASSWRGSWDQQDQDG